MKDCIHENTVKTKITRSLSDHTFSANSLVCKDCNAELWNEKLNKKFNLWMSELGVKPRIQFKVSHIAERCLDEKLTRFPGANRAVFVRAMIAVYFFILEQKPEVNEMFNKISESDIYNSFETDTTTKMFQTDVRAFFFFEIQSWGKAFDLKTNEIAHEAFHLMMALCVSEDEELKKFWENIILPQIETIIKAA